MNSRYLNLGVVIYNVALHHRELLILLPYTMKLLTDTLMYKMRKRRILVNLKIDNDVSLMLDTRTAQIP